jgi:hypothetical protein
VSLQRWLAGALAVALPAAILGGALAGLDRYRPEEADSTPHQWDKRLKERRKVKVIIFGNSMAKRDIDLQLLAQNLGLKKNDVMSLTVPDSGGSLWYAALKNRVYAQGYEPQLILMAADLSAMLGTTPLTDEDERELIAQLTDDEEVIAEKVYDGSDFRWLRLKQHRGDIRAATLSGIRDLSVGTVFGESDKNSLVQGRNEARPALDRVFDDEKVDWTLHNRVIPIVEERDALGTYELAQPAASLIPDICSMATDHGTPLVFVRTPLSPDNTDDYHPPSTERSVPKLLNELGCGYLDMRGLDLRDRHFDDPLHLNEAGATLFTQNLAKALKEMNALSEEPLKPAIVPIVASTMERTGTPPKLPQPPEATELSGCVWSFNMPKLASMSEASLAGAGMPGGSPFELMQDGHRLVAINDMPASCDGTFLHADDNIVFAPTSAWNATASTWRLAHRPEFPISADDGNVYWAYPGTTVRMVFDDAWQGPEGSFEIRLVGERFGGGEASPTLVVNGDEPITLDQSGNRYKVAVVADPPRDRWTLNLHVPTDGPYFAIQGLTVGKGYGASMVIGTLADNRGSASRLVGGVSERGTEPNYRDEPPKFDTPETYRRGPRNSGRFHLPRHDFLSDAETKRRVPYPTRCSPLRAVENGHMLPLPHVECGDVQVQGAGRQCHDGDNLYFSSVDGSDPLSNGKQYGVVLDPDRRCSRAWWLYPEDEFSITADPAEMVAFRDGISQVELDLIAFHGGPEAWQVRVLLEADGKPWIDQRVGAQDFRRGAKQWRLDPPIPAGTTDVKLSLHSEAHNTFLLATMLSLSEFTDFGPGRRGGSRQMPFVLTREGVPPELPQKADWKRFERTETPCGWRFVVGYPWISDKEMFDAGYGRASPIRMYENGRGMKAHATVREFQGTCAGAFGHTGPFIWFSPLDDVESPTDRDYELRFASELPVSRIGGEPMYWVYPGTGLRLDFDGWNEKWGDPELVVQISELRGAKQTGQAALFLNDTEYPIDPAGFDRVTITPTLEFADGEWYLAVRSPEDGPFLVVRHLGVGPAGRRHRVFGRFTKAKEIE